ncbi:HlyD family secretion protein [Compostibacter hankyongensis]|uniref:HlyD family secretion protein n=1 Tax=Compostibacter hankyongensis TaxID=1007089 RepID=A0ABP8FTY6_9BACT
MKQTQKRRISPKKIVPVILGLVLVFGIIFGIKEYIYYQHYVTTDDAQIDGDISPVVARVSGYVKDIRFRDNQFIHAGDTLVVIDDRDYRIKLEQANAALDAARANVSVSRSNVSSVSANVPPAQANVAAAESRLWKVTQDYNRYLNLLKDHAITQSQFDEVKAAKDAAEAELAAAKKQVAAIGEQIGASREQVAATRSSIALRQADVDFAQLQLSYTVIIAPVSGVISRRNIQIGQLVQPGQTMFAIVNDSSIYVTANFKETQLAHLKAGQPATIEVDAYPDTTFEAVVENFSGATGAKFSLLPPDNATGNFVKVVQRVPIRIYFKQLTPEWRRKLRPGLSVFTTIRIKE